MTGKQQKAINMAKEMMSQVELSVEDRAKLMDEAVCEVHTANEALLEKLKMSITMFRNMYIVHTFFDQIDKLVMEKCKAETDKRISTYLEEQKLARRK